MTANYQDFVRTSLKEKTVFELFKNYLESKNIKYSLNEGEITFNTRANLYSWGEKIKIRFSEGIVVISSQCKLKTQILDWGKNKRNVIKFKKLLVQGET